MVDATTNTAEINVDASLRKQIRAININDIHMKPYAFIRMNTSTTGDRIVHTQRIFELCIRSIKVTWGGINMPYQQ